MANLPDLQQRFLNYLLHADDSIANDIVGGSHDERAFRAVDAAHDDCVGDCDPVGHTAMNNNTPGVVEPVGHQHHSSRDID